MTSSAYVCPRRITPTPDAPFLDLVRRALNWWEAQAGEAQTDPTIGTGAVAALERAGAAVAGVRFGLAMPSATLGLRVALQAVGVGPGDEVIVPSYDWTAAAAAVHSLGAMAVGADVTLPDCFLDPRDIGRRVTARTRAAVISHLFGVPGDVPELVRACQPFGLPVIEDCAQALGAAFDGQPVGGRGHLGVMSFGSGKLLDSSGGGVIVTDDEELYVSAVRASQHPARQLICGIHPPEHATLCLRISGVGAIVAAYRLVLLPAELRRQERHVQELAARLKSCSGLRPPSRLGRRRCVGRHLPVVVEDAGALDAAAEVGLAAQPPGQLAIARLLRQAAGCPTSDTAHDRVRLISLARRPTSRSMVGGRR